VSLIDRVRYLAGGITAQQSRAVVAEVYRRIGEGTLAATNPHDLALVLVAHANGLIQQNAADTISGVEPPLSLPTDQLVDPDVERLCRAREALVATGYFTAEQVGDDIAARVLELFWAMQEKQAAARPSAICPTHGRQAHVDDDDVSGEWPSCGVCGQELLTESEARSPAGMLCGRCEHEMPSGGVHQHHAVIANACVGCAACSAGREVGWRP
jgi:hypothetical protein